MFVYDSDCILNLLIKKQVNIDEICILIFNLRLFDSELCYRYNSCRNVGYKLSIDEFIMIKRCIIERRKK